MSIILSRVELIQYIREHAPDTKYVSKMNKKELKNIYSELTKTEGKEVLDEVEITIDFSGHTREQLIYDIVAFLKLQGKYLSGVKGKTKPNLLNAVKVLKVDKHYTKEDKDEIEKISQAEDDTKLSEWGLKEGL